MQAMQSQVETISRGPPHCKARCMVSLTKVSMPARSMCYKSQVNNVIFYYSIDDEGGWSSLGEGRIVR
jgi:hypothetical protein